MTLSEVMGELKAAGTEQNRKIYLRHGAGTNVFGVSFANLYKFAKRIKADHALAGQLWATGNGDARCLAMMIAEPEKASMKELESWVKSVSCYGHADLLARFTSKTAYAGRCMAAWRKSPRDFIGQTGWDLVGLEAMRPSEVPDSFFAEILGVIERDIHKAANRTRYAMNGALIGIGLRNARLKKLAIAAARRIGKVEVDHGETGCRTPDAVPYIEKASQRQAMRR